MKRRTASRKTTHASSDQRRVWCYVWTGGATVMKWTPTEICATLGGHQPIRRPQPPYGVIATIHLVLSQQGTLNACYIALRSEPTIFRFGRKIRVTCPCLQSGGLAHRLALGKVDIFWSHSSGKMRPSRHAAAMIDGQHTHNWRALNVY